MAESRDPEPTAAEWQKACQQTLKVLAEQNVYFAFNGDLCAELARRRLGRQPEGNWSFNDLTHRQQGYIAACKIEYDVGCKGRAKFAELKPNGMTFDDLADTMELILQDR